MSCETFWNSSSNRRPHPPSFPLIVHSVAFTNVVFVKLHPAVLVSGFFVLWHCQVKFNLRNRTQSSVLSTDSSHHRSALHWNGELHPVRFVFEFMKWKILHPSRGVLKCVASERELQQINVHGEAAHVQCNNPPTLCAQSPLTLTKCRWILEMWMIDGLGAIYMHLFFALFDYDKRSFVSVGADLDVNFKCHWPSHVLNKYLKHARGPRRNSVSEPPTVFFCSAPNTQVERLSTMIASLLVNWQVGLLVSAASGNPMALTVFKPEVYLALLCSDSSKIPLQACTQCLSVCYGHKAKWCMLR